MTAHPVFILGGYQTDFARNWAREGKGLLEMLAEATEGVLAVAKVGADELEVAHVGNFVSDLFTGQAHLGGLLAEAVPGLRGLPISRHEAACASGSMAILAAMADLESGRYDVACVVGLELMRNVAGETAARHLAAAAWIGQEAQEARYCWPHMFNGLSADYERRYRLDYKHLGRIAEINYFNARVNPLAQTRQWRFTDNSFQADDIANPVIDGWVRRNDCGQVTDGAAAVVLVNARGWERLAAQRGMSLAKTPRITGWGHRTARMSYTGKVADSAQNEWMFPHVRQTISDALGRAGINDVFDLDAVETHDCFAITEYMAIDHFGLTPPGKAWQAIEQGWIEKGGKLPFNPTGGLIGLGHPVGATGVRMLVDAWRQVAGVAGDCQVDHARNVVTLNIGGSTTTVASFVVGREA